MLRSVALASAVIGGASSVLYLLQSGRRNSELLLLVAMFSMWVLSPFLVLCWTILRSERLTQPVRATLYGLTIVLALASLAIYSRLIDVKPEGSPNTFLFVAVPPVSLLLIAATLSLAALRSRKQA
jgi:hypothetical protein